MVSIGGNQVRIAAVPPFITLTATITPEASNYAMIGYRAILGNEMVPGAFSATLQFAGGAIYSGVITQEPIRNGFQAFFVITRVTPLIITVRNLTGLFQYFEVIDKFLVVSTQNDMELIYKALEELAMAGHNEMLAETNRLLTDIRKALLLAPPPLPGIRR